MRTLIVVRHAHRNKPRGSAFDNGLSAKGRIQAREISAYFRKSFSRSSPVLLSSPKKRCIETLEPISRKVGVSIAPESLLDEGSTLSRRAKSFLRRWRRSSAPLTVICSHGDWIPEFFRAAIGLELELKKGGWARLDLGEDGVLRLTWVIQDFAKFF